MKIVSVILHEGVESILIWQQVGSVRLRPGMVEFTYDSAIFNSIFFQYCFLICGAHRDFPPPEVDFPSPEIT